MIFKQPIRICGLIIVLICGLLISCGPSQEEPAPAALEPTLTPSNTLAPLPTSTPTITLTPTSTATPTITITPTITPTLSPKTLTIGPEDPIRIGYLLPESMDHGIDAQRGIEIAIDDFGNELLGHPIKLTGLDTRCNVLDARRAAMNLVAEGDFLGIIGTLCSSAAVPVAKVLSSAGVVMISPSNSSPELTAPNLHQPIYLRTFPNDAVQGIAVARFAFEELGARTMAFVYYFNEPYSLLIRDAACEEFTSLGGECVADKVMNHGDTYISLNSIGAASPDVLYSIIYSDEAALIISQSSEVVGFENTVMIFQEQSFNSRFIDLVREDAIGTYISRTPTDIDSHAYQTFLMGYQNKFGAEPLSIFHPFAYDATKMLLNAIERVAIRNEDGTLIIDPEAIRVVLFNTVDFEGVSGSLTCSSTGDCASDTFGGMVYEVTSDDPGTWDPGAHPSANPIQVWPKP